ncbi:MAG: ATP-binding cassette domain-containing protein, partial [Candidatus Omnitrophica bacterium]|nr:ATP-binding cassette domain-containing protein [Candidatus Omnitrophota bacterium]
LYDCPPGTIFWDGTDIREFKIASLMERVAFVGQQAYLMGESLRENLTYGANREVPDEEIIGMLEKLGLDRFVSTYRSRGDLLIGKQGVHLSGGEKQRLALGRALLRNADLYILDEPLNAVDLGTEEVVMERIFSFLKGKTLLVVSHRQEAVASFDSVLRMEKKGIKKIFLNAEDPVPA